MTGRIEDVVAERVGALSRAEIGLIPPVSVSRNIDASRGGAVLHYGGSNVPISSHLSCIATFRSWQRYHMGKNFSPPASGHGWVDLAYTLGVCQHGYTLAGRGEGIRTAANGTNDGNFRFHAIVWIGGERQTPTQLALNAMAFGVLALRDGGAGDRVIGHSDLRYTGCPGAVILRLARFLDRKPIPLPKTAEPPKEDEEEDDMKKLIHIGKRGGTAYELVDNPADPSAYALRPVPNRSVADAITGRETWPRETVVMSEADAAKLRIL